MADSPVVSDSLAGSAGQDAQTHLVEAGGPLAYHPAYSGRLVIATGGGARLSAAGTALAVYEASPSTRACDAQATLTIESKTSGVAGVAVCVDRTAQTFYLLGYNVLGGFWAINRVVANVWTELARWSAVPQPTSTTAHLKIRGTQITGIIDGTARLSVVDSAPILAAGGVGDYRQASVADTDTAGTHITAFSASDVDPLLALLIDDTSLPHEKIPHGVPSTYSWYAVPVIQAGNDPGGYPYIVPWGQVYTEADGNPQPSALAEVREMGCYVLSKTTGHWTMTYNNEWPPLHGSEYPESFVGPILGATIDTSVPGSIISSPTPDHVFHFYPNASRGGLGDPSDVAGVVTTIRARLTPGSYDPAGAAPGLIFNIGCDYWSAATGGTAHGVGEGRFKQLGPDWRLATFCTITDPAVLAANMPPILDADEME